MAKQSPDVVAGAATFAEHFDAELVCVSVDASRYPIERHPDGTVTAASIDSDLADDGVLHFDEVIRTRIAEVLAQRPVRWSTRALAGNPAKELSRIATELAATMIVVGTRNAGLRGSLREVINGSVAVQLAHRQHRPVVVIPQHPVDADLSRRGGTD
ncbi:universal stress protein [Granulicoccus phenolivorans]|uniref:universal stress protein n=1 Tax=Granulicoccus phenolivorans TaxID=266854 RepID=UPI00040D909C|nr:universal stress protein [Granulicoccus phenolivorans]